MLLREVLEEETKKIRRKEKTGRNRVQAFERQINKTREWVRESSSV
jgi:hypothetical protein